MDRSAAPARFQAALQSLSHAQIRPEIHLVEIPAPRQIAPFAVAIDGEVDAVANAAANLDPDDPENQVEVPPAQGSFLVLYDPQGQENWNGQFRIVIFLEVQVDGAEAADPILPSVAWSWVSDAIGHAPVGGLGGTVSLTSSSSFGELAETPAKSIVQIRASFSPVSEQVGPYMAMWAEMLATAAGLERLPSTVASLDEHREAHH